MQLANTSVLVSRPERQPTNGNLRLEDRFANTPEAFAGMLRGENFGKLIIGVAD